MSEWLAIRPNDIQLVRTSNKFLEESPQDNLDGTFKVVLRNYDHVRIMRPFASLAPVPFSSQRQYPVPKITIAFRFVVLRFCL